MLVTSQAGVDLYDRHLTAGDAEKARQLKEDFEAKAKQYKEAKLKEEEQVTTLPAVYVYGMITSAIFVNVYSLLAPLNASFEVQDGR